MTIGNLYVSIMIGSCLFINSLSGQSQARAVYDLGVKHGTMGSFEAAKVAFEKAFKIDSLFIPAKLNLIIVNDVLDNKIEEKAAIFYFQGIELGNINNLENKIEMLNEALNRDPNFGLAYNERGIAYAKKEQYPEAIQDYDTALKFHTDFPEIYFNKALSCDKLERLEEAQQAYENFLQFTHPSYTWYIIYARKRIYEIKTYLNNNQSEQD